MQIQTALASHEGLLAPHQRLNAPERSGTGGLHDLSRADADGKPEAAESVAQFKYRRSERTTLFIQTQEGDTIRLKFRTREAARLKTGDTDDGGESVLTTRNSSRLSIQVRGDLNPEELAAIQATVDTAMNIADDFFGGDVESAFESAAAMDVDGEQLARIRLGMRVKEQLTYERPILTGAPMVRGGDGSESRQVRIEPVELGPPEPEVRTETTARPVGVGESGESGEVRFEPVELDPPRTTDGSADAPDLNDRPNPFEVIADFLGRLLDAFMADREGGTGGLLEMSLKIRVTQATISTLASDRPEGQPHLPDLVPETLEALASLDQPGLDQVA